MNRILVTATFLFIIMYDWEIKVIEKVKCVSVYYQYVVKFRRSKRILLVSIKK